MASKKSSKIENNAENESKPKGKPAKTASEPTTRVLRPRKPGTSYESSDVPKTKPKPASTKAKNAKNGKTDDTEAPKRAKKSKKESVEENGEAGESESKRTKSEEESEYIENNDAANIYEFAAKDINGKDVSLEKYKGYPCIIVNVASKCSHTSSNYKEFVELFDKYSKDKGLRILAFPCNQFNKQEPGDNDKICEFAKKKNVEFDMFAKIDVNGDEAHPLWKYLKSQKPGPKGEDIEWNFTKFLINKDGEVVGRFKASVKPSALVKELETIW